MRALQYVIILITVMISVVLHGQVGVVIPYRGLRFPVFDYETEQIITLCDIDSLTETLHSTIMDLNEKINSDSSYIINMHLLGIEFDALFILELSSGIMFERTTSLCARSSFASNLSNYRIMYQWYLANKDSVDFYEYAKLQRDIMILDGLEFRNATDSTEKKLISDSIKLIESRHPSWSKYLYNPGGLGLDVNDPSSYNRPYELTDLPLIAPASEVRDSVSVAN